MADVVLDTNVLVNASIPESKFLSLLVLIGNSGDLFLAVDRGGKILQEYSRKISSTRFASQWLKKMIADNRVSYFDSNLERKYRIYLLDKLHFDPDDIVFVSVSSKSFSKELVTDDDDYSLNVVRYLRRELDVTVFDVDTFLGRVSSVPDQDM